MCFTSFFVEIHIFAFKLKWISAFGAGEVNKNNDNEIAEKSCAKCYQVLAKI
jgi:hypothetical protein